jgi:hypothetical protein
MFAEGLTEVDLPEDFGQPTDETARFVNRDLNLALYQTHEPPTLSLILTDIEKIDKLN